MIIFVVNKFVVILGIYECYLIVDGKDYYYIFDS